VGRRREFAGADEIVGNTNGNEIEDKGKEI
jgi:hypothetical protein